MTNKTILIVGQAGPQGKTYLKKRLRRDGYQVVEIRDVAECNLNEFYRYHTKSYETIAILNGERNGFLVINFKNDFIKQPDHNYVMPDEEYNNIIKNIEEGNDVTYDK